MHILTFEFCIKCPQHQWCTSHEEKKYLKHFQACKKAIEENMTHFTDLGLGQIEIRENEIPEEMQGSFMRKEEGYIIKRDGGKRLWPRIGAFEIYLDGKVVFSKLTSGRWPNPATVFGLVQFELCNVANSKLEPLPGVSSNYSFTNARSARNLRIKRLNKNRNTTASPSKGKIKKQRNISRSIANLRPNILSNSRTTKTKVNKSGLVSSTKRYSPSLKPSTQAHPTRKCLTNRSTRLTLHKERSQPKQEHPTKLKPKFDPYPPKKDLLNINTHTKPHAQYPLYPNPNAISNPSQNKNQNYLQNLDMAQSHKLISKIYRLSMPISIPVHKV